jgi:hypothetical protein
MAAIGTLRIRTNEPSYSASKIEQAREPIQHHQKPQVPADFPPLKDIPRSSGSEKSEYALGESNKESRLRSTGTPLKRLEDRWRSKKVKM